MHRIGIRHLLAAIGASALVGLALALGLFALYARQVDRALTEIVQVQEPLLFNLQVMYAQGLQTEQATRNIILNPTDGKAKDNYAKADQDFRKALAAATGLASGPVREELSRLGPRWDEAHALKTEAQSLAVAGSTAEAVDLLNRKETPAWRGIKDIILAQADRQATASKASAELVMRSTETTEFKAYAVALAALAGVAALLYLTGRRITRPLERIRDTARSVADGDYSARLEGRYTGELKDTAEAIEKMIRSLEKSLGFYQGIVSGMATPYVVVDADETLVMTNRTLLELLQQDGRPEEQYGRNVAEFFYGEKRRTVLRDAMEQDRPLTREVELVGRKGAKRMIRIDASPLKNSITGQLMGSLCVYTDLTELRQHEAQAVEQNRRIIDAATRAEAISGTVAVNTQQLSARIDEVENGAGEQQSRVSATATAMGELNQTVLEVARSAANASESSEDAKRRAQAGEGVVRDVVQSISRVRDEAKSLKESMDGLGRQAESIGRVMEVISDIADQTNLLALNAAIEAARAGDAGRGFAVVADEVRKLAEKTMQATSEVGQAIVGIQQSARSNMQSVDSAARSVEEATVLARSSGEVLAEIVRMVEVATDQVRTIATAAEEQSAAGDEITRSIQDVSRISDRIADAMRDASQAVGHLASQAQELREVMGGMSS